MVIKRIGVGSLAKISGAFYACIGLIVGALFALISLFSASFAMAAQDDQMPGIFGALFGVGAIIIFPILYGVLGLVGGAIAALLYNLFAGIAGGLEVEVQQ